MSCFIRCHAVLDLGAVEGKMQKLQILITHDPCCEITQLEIRAESRDETASFPGAQDGTAAPQSVLRCPPPPPSHPLLLAILFW